MAVFGVDGAVGRATRRVATSAPFRKVGPKVVPWIDRRLHALTGGRVLVSRALVPSLMLTTTGRRSGEPRTTPLACVPSGADTWYVVGSNFGQEHHPAWTGNLLAEPRATVAYGKDGAVPVRAELLSEDEKAEVWPRLVAVWPAYDDYVESSGRSLRVFRLRRTEA